MPNRRRLVSSRTYLRLIEDGGPIGTWNHDYLRSVSSWSPGMCRQFGREPQEMPSDLNGIASLVHADDQPLFTEALAMFRTGHEWEVKCRVTWPDGQVRWMILKGVPNVTHDGKILDVAGYVLDITTQHRSLEIHRYREQMLALLATEHGILMWKCSVDGALVGALHWTTLTGQPFERIRDFKWLDFVHPDERKTVSAYFRNQIKAGEKSSITFRFLIPLAGHTSIRALMTPVRDRNGTLVEWIGMSLGMPETDRLAIALESLEGKHLRAARALLNWTMEDVADNASMSLSTIRRAEDGGLVAIGARSQLALRSTFEAAGVRFEQINSREVAVILTTKSSQRALEMEGRDSARDSLGKTLNMSSKAIGR